MLWMYSTSIPSELSVSDEIAMSEKTCRYDRSRLAAHPTSCYEAGKKRLTEAMD